MRQSTPVITRYCRHRPSCRSHLHVPVDADIAEPPRVPVECSVPAHAVLLRVVLLSSVTVESTHERPTALLSLRRDQQAQEYQDATGRT